MSAKLGRSLAGYEQFYAASLHVLLHSTTPVLVEHKEQLTTGWNITANIVSRLCGGAAAARAASKAQQQRQFPLLLPPRYLWFAVARKTAQHTAA